MEVALKQGIFARFLRLSFKFLAASTVASVSTFGASLLLAKALSLEAFSTLAIIQATIAIIEGFAFSQSWQAVVRFFPTHPHNIMIVGRLLGFALKADMVNIVLAVIAIIIAITASTWLNLNQPDLLLIYGVVLPFRMNGTWQGLARVKDRLGLINAQLVIAGIGKLLTALVIFFIPTLGLKAAVWGFTIAEVAGFLVLIIGGICILYKNWSVSELLKNSLYPSEIDCQIKKFIWVNHFNVSTVLAIRNIDELIIAKLISLEAVGIYKLIKLISALLSKLVEPMYIVIYPELTRLLAEKRAHEVRSLLSRITRITSIAAFIFLGISAAMGSYVLSYFAGENATSGYWPMLIYVLGIAVNIIFFYAHPLAIAVGLESYVLKINIITGIIYLVLLWYLASMLGLIGIAIAVFLYISASTMFRLFASNKVFVELI